MNRTRWIALTILFLALLSLSIVFQSKDPGIKGTLADIGFFGALLILVFFIVAGARALAARYRKP
jgi:hypothetical protein